MKYELEVISDIVSNPDKNGKTKIIKKDDLIKKIFDLEASEIEEYVEPRNGKHIKKYSVIYLNNVSYKINKPYEELKYLVLNRSTPVIGFVGKYKTYKHGTK